MARFLIQIIREKKSNKVRYKFEKGGSRVALKTAISMTMHLWRVCTGQAFEIVVWRLCLSPLS
jgi:hypothetical protein